MRILIKGAGDLATGVAHKLRMCGFDILMTEIPVPTTVRRMVAFSRAVYESTAEVEGVKAKLAKTVSDAEKIIGCGMIAVVVDEKCEIAKLWKPDVIIDAILAKKNTGTKITDAPAVIALGPGFTAGKDCRCVIETKRGHYLGRVITKGSAVPNTGIPGNVGGYSAERIIRATAGGSFMPGAQIGDRVEKGQILAYSGGQPVFAKMSGIVRGMLQKDVVVTAGMKCGDIDARCEKDHCYTISDKARAIAGGALEAVLRFSKSAKMDKR